MPTETRFGSDREFDRAYPLRLRRVAALYWTPVRVAELAARFLAPSPRARVLDVGAGGGKVCVVGALVTGARFTGVEHDPALVTAARAAARFHGAARVSFELGGLDAVSWRDF